jgi:hypothetical protein
MMMVKIMIIYGKKEAADVCVCGDTVRQNL